MARAIFLSMEKPMFPNESPVYPARRGALASALAAVLLFAGQSAASAQSAGPFSGFAGSFRGGGEVVARDGRRERISCRATGAVGGGGRTLSQNIVCASDSYRFDIRGQVAAQGSNVQGDWQETTRGVSGAITGRASDEHFNGVVNAGGFTASFTLRASGRKMYFGLRPSDGEIALVSVALSR
jgi:hypothetical protein